MATNYYRYLPVGNREIVWGHYLFSAGHATIAAGSAYPPSGHPKSHAFDWQKGRRLSEYQILFIADGEGEFEDQSGRNISVGAGDAILLFPNVWHRYRPKRETGWSEYWVSLAGPTVDGWVKGGIISPELPVIHIKDRLLLVDAYTRILDHIRHERPGYSQLIAAEASTIVANIVVAERSEGMADELVDKIRNAKHFLEEEVGQLPEMRQLAARLHLSTSHFYRLFKEQTGLSPYQYHLQIRINRARDLLRTTQLSIKQIASMLGFSNTYHFSKTFKGRIGMSPSRWRHFDKLEDVNG
jgi:AraC-like DNA-binding protein/mannose-6-phosphate isomerase-like protein (cupin superfamily)